MGGEFTVKSELEKGSAISFTIPLKKPDESNPLSCTFPMNIRGLKALIVEDYEKLGEILKRILTKFNFRATCVKTGEEALKTYNDALKH